MSSLFQNDLPNSQHINLLSRTLSSFEADTRRNSTSSSISNNSNNSSSSSHTHHSIHSYSDNNDNNNNNTDRRCWICFGEDKDSEGRWVKPCPCSLEAHEQCLLDWISENQKGRSAMKKVTCPQCGMPYYLLENQSLSLLCLEFLQSIIRSTAPYLTVLGLGCSILIAASTYGAYTVLTLFGTKEGEKLLGNTKSWTWRTFFGLPSIPFVLIASRSRLADGILPIAAIALLRASSPVIITWPPSPALVVGSLPWIRLIYFSIYSLIRRHLAQKLGIQVSTNRRRTRYIQITLYRQRSQQQHQQQQEQHIINHLDHNPLVENDNATLNNLQESSNGRSTSTFDTQDADVLYGRSDRDLNVTIMGALLWPTISSLVGNCLKQIKWIRNYFPEAFHRNVLGGCLFVVIKDMITLLYRYERIRQRRSRRVRSFDETLKKD